MFLLMLLALLGRISAAQDSVKIEFWFSNSDCTGTADSEQLVADGTCLTLGDNSFTISCSGVDVHLASTTCANAPFTTLPESACVDNVSASAKYTCISGEAVEVSCRRIYIF
jgi:hypothetical protein